MPTYEFVDTEKEEIFEKFMSFSQREQFLKENPHIKSIISAPGIISYAGGDLYSRTPSGFKDVLAKVAEAHPSSTVAERFGKRSIKQTRTDEVVKKYADKVSKRNS